MFRIDRFLTLHFFRFWTKKSAPGELTIPILMYHSISDDPEKGIPHYYRLTTSPARFREQMQLIRDCGYTVISLSDAVLKLKSTNLTQERFAVLTFDDGYRDFYTDAWPVLKDFGYPATVFLATDFIGETPKVFKNRECMTWTEVRELRDNGISFGSHTMSHPVLYGLPWSSIRTELKESRRQIENKLQSPAEWFCYPYAFPQEDKSFVHHFQKELLNQGYTGMVTTVIGSAGKNTDSVCLPRLPVNGSDDDKLFKAQLAGAYDWMTYPQTFARKIKSKFRKNQQT